MFHTIAHIAFLLSEGCVSICILILLIVLLTAFDTPRQMWRNLAWGFPAAIIGLGSFWAAVAYGLSLI